MKKEVVDEVIKRATELFEYCKENDVAVFIACDTTGEGESEMYGGMYGDGICVANMVVSTACEHKVFLEDILIASVTALMLKPNSETIQ